ncbi:hypothetical protein CsSME_00035057 [Camellia sinensis var. sinensis]
MPSAGHLSAKSVPLPAKNEALPATNEPLPAIGALSHHTATEHKQRKTKGFPRECLGDPLSFGLVCLHIWINHMRMAPSLLQMWHLARTVLSNVQMLSILLSDLGIGSSLVVTFTMRTDYSVLRCYSNKGQLPVAMQCPLDKGQFSIVFGSEVVHLKSKFRARATVDTPFLTVLKTWTSSFEHSMIIHVCVHFEFSEVSVARLASRPLDLFVLCLVVDQTLVFLLLRAENGLLAIPTPHRPWLEATGPVFLLLAKGVGRSALFLVGRPLFWSIGHFFWPRPFLFLFQALCIPAVPAGSSNLCSNFSKKLEPFVLASTRSLNPLVSL